MGTIASQITSLAIVYSIDYSSANQRKHQSSASLAFVQGIHRGPVNSPHKWPVTRKMFPFDDVIMHISYALYGLLSMYSCGFIVCSGLYNIFTNIYQLAPLTLGQSLYCLAAIEATLKNMGVINRYQITTKHYSERFMSILLRSTFVIHIYCIYCFFLQ